MPLKVLSYNVGAESETRLSAIVEVIREQDPDLVALLDPENQSLAAAFARTLGMSAHYGEGNHGWGVVWLSKLPIQHAQNRRWSLPSLPHLGRVSVRSIERTDKGVHAEV